MRISDWSSDVCSSDLQTAQGEQKAAAVTGRQQQHGEQEGGEGREEAGQEGEAQRLRKAGLGEQLCPGCQREALAAERREVAEGGQPGADQAGGHRRQEQRSEEHTSELQSLMRISYAVFCLKKNTKTSQLAIYTSSTTDIMNHKHKVKNKDKP